MTGAKGIAFLENIHTPLGSHGLLLSGYGRLLPGMVKYVGFYVLLLIPGAFQYETLWTRPHL